MGNHVTKGRSALVVLLLFALVTVMLALPAVALSVEPTPAGPLPGTSEWCWLWPVTGGLAFPSLSGDLFAFTVIEDYGRTASVGAYDLATDQYYDIPDSMNKQRCSQAAGHLVAWAEVPSGMIGAPPSGDVMLYDLTSGQLTNVTADEDPLRAPQVALSERLLAWDADWDVAGTIWARDLMTDQTVAVTEQGLNPVACDAFVAWCSPVSEASWELWVYDAATGQSTSVATVEGDYTACYPDMSGDRIAYQRLDPVSGAYDICVYDLSEGQEQRLELPGDQRYPRIAGDVIGFNDYGVYQGRVWWLGTNRVYDVDGLGSGIEEIDADHIVYETSMGGGGSVWCLYTFSLDTTAPAITVTQPVEGANYLQGQEVDAEFTANDDDSGVAAVTPALPTPENPVPVDTSTMGDHTFTVTATDNAGNVSETTIHYTVAYTSPGVAQPVNPDGSSVFKSGSTIPLKFALTDEAGLPVTGLQPKLYLARLDGDVLGDELEAVSTCQADVGNTFREVDLGQYQFNLSTKRMKTGYYRARIDLGNGAQMIAYFSVM